MTEVTAGIYQLKLPLPDSPLDGINTYLVRGDDEYLLIDTGWNIKESFEALEKQLADIGIGFQNISKIVITHVHSDHYGLAGRIKSLSNAQLYLHQLEKDFIQSRYINMDELLQQLGEWLRTNGVPANELSDLQMASVRTRKYVDPILPDITLHGDETISIGSFSFKVIPTPGHSRGHISLYEPDKKILIAGDHILPTITPNIGLHPQSSINPLGDYLNSLDGLKQLEVNLILPGHEQPFTGLKQRIEELIQHHKQRISKILEMITAEPKTGYQIAAKLTWMADINGGVNWHKLGSWDKRMAVLEILAHLELMRVEGKVNKFTRDSIIYYQST